MNADTGKEGERGGEGEYNPHQGRAQRRTECSSHVLRHEPRIASKRASTDMTVSRMKGERQNTPTKLDGGNVAAASVCLDAGRKRKPLRG